MRARRRALLAAALAPLAGAVLLGIEILVARQGPVAPDPPPPSINELVGPDIAASNPSAGVPIVVWMGDSTAAGVGASRPETSLPQQVAAQLGKAMRLTVLARSGARVADVVRSQLPEVAKATPDVVFISVGANDAVHATSRSDFRRDLDHLLRELPAASQVVVLGVPDMGAPPRLPQPLRAVVGWRGRALDDDIRHAAGDHRALYVDIAAHTGPSFRRHPDRYFAADHYHPNDAGYGLWASAIVADAPGVP